LFEGLEAQAKSLARSLSHVFDTPTGIPNNLIIDVSRQILSQDTSNSIAGFGTLVLEWTRLTDLTKDDIYGRLAQRAEEYIISPEAELGVSPLPDGLLGQHVKITTGLFADADGGWVAGSDSAYEYLIKMYLYDPDRFENYKDRWVAAADATMRYLSSHPTTRPDLTYLAAYQNGEATFHSQHCKPLPSFKPLKSYLLFEV
jgi:mannosyl-oligosaccharide alpha-1,2-mannosidase